MNSFHQLLLRLSRFPKRNSFPLFHFVSQSLSTTITPINTQLNLLHPSTPSTSNKAKIITIHLANCANISELKQIHAHIIRTHILELFNAPFYWNNIIRCYTRIDYSNTVLCIFTAMLRAGILPDCYTIPIVMKCVCQNFYIDLGLQIHCVAVKIGLDCNEFCESGFINLYAKVGDFENAYKVFDENGDRKLGSWNAIIGGLAQNGRAKEAIDMFISMREYGFFPDNVTLVSVTSACGSLGNLELGLQLHKCVFQAKTFRKSEILMLNSLIDMYGKCGKMDLACKVFLNMEQRNVSSWTSMIVGHAMHGHVIDALECFRCMKESGVKPNHVTFIGILNACVHGGMVQEGKYYFDMMKRVYKIMPKMQHYGCMVDLLGRAGLFDEAIKMVEKMPIRANSVIWGCLMGACEKHGNVEMGEYVAKILQELEPWNDGVYVVLSNIYANRGMWKEAERVRGFMKNSKVAKIPAYSLACPQVHIEGG